MKVILVANWVVLMMALEAEVLIAFFSLGLAMRSARAATWA